MYNNIGSGNNVLDKHAILRNDHFVFGPLAI